LSRHVTVNNNDILTGLKTFLVPLVLGGITPAFLMDDTTLDPTVLRIRKSGGDIEIVNNLTNVVLRSLLSTEIPQSVGSVLDQGTSTNIALSDHTHQGVHSIKADGYSQLYGDLTLSFGDGFTFTQTGQTINLDADMSNTPAMDVGDIPSQGTSNELSRAGHQHKGLHSLSKLADTQLFGDITIQAGTNITVTLADQGVIVSQSGAGGPLPTFFSLPNPLPVTSGGTGFNNYTVGDLLVANTTVSLTRLQDVALGNVLLSGGIGQMPFWGKASLSQHFTGTLVTTRIADGSPAGRALQTTGSGVAYALLDLANTTGVLPLAKLADDVVADKPLLSGGPSADPHYGSLPSGVITGDLTLSQIPGDASTNVPLLAGGAGSPPDPAYAPLNLSQTNATSGGPLPLDRGGTNNTTIDPTNHRIMIFNGNSITQGPGSVNTNGRILINATGGVPKEVNITAGTGISIVNASGSITISGSGGTSLRDLHECRLVLDGTNLRLRPYNGNFLTIYESGSPVHRAFSGDGPTLDSSGTSIATTYAIFAYWDGSNIQLEKQALVWGGQIGVYQEFPTNSNKVLTKFSDNTRRFVGVAHTNDDGSGWRDTEEKRYIWSLFNQRQRFARSYLQVGGDPGIPGTGYWPQATFTPMKILCAYSLYTAFNSLDNDLGEPDVHISGEITYYNNTGLSSYFETYFGIGAGTVADTVFAGLGIYGAGKIAETVPTSSEIRVVNMTSSYSRYDFFPIHGPSYSYSPAWFTFYNAGAGIPKLVSQGKSVSITATYMG